MVIQYNYSIMTSNALISIVVPVYKVEQYIERFIHSVINQTDHDFELILVDDVSLDRSIEIAEGMLKEHCREYKIVHRKVNGGLSAARNSGIEMANGEYLFFADSDDELELDAVANMRKYISQYPMNSIFFFNATFKNPSDTIFQRWREPGQVPQELSLDAFLTLLYTGKIGAYIWQFLFKKEVFKNVRFKEGVVWEDSIIVPQLASITDKVMSLDHLFIYKYWIREGSISQSIHPSIDQVVPALDEVEYKLYPLKNETLYNDFVLFRTTLTMRLSRECFVRTKDFSRLMHIHKSWGHAIPKQNIISLKNMGRKKSAYFLILIKYFPSILYFLYRIKFLH